MNENKENITIGIDASGIRSGGSYVYLRNLLEDFKPEEFPQIEKIIVWGIENVLDKIQSDPIIEKVSFKLLESFNPIKLFLWKIYLQYFRAPKECDLLYVPGGIIFNSKIPKVIMLHNLLPFEHELRKLYKGTFSYYKFLLLEKLFKYSCRHAEGIIYPTNFTRRIIQEKTQVFRRNNVVIFHSIGRHFLKYGAKIDSKPCKPQKDGIKLLSVSSIAPYKGQMDLLQEFEKLIHKGWNISLTFVGSITNNLQNSFKNKIDEINRKKKVFAIWGLWIIRIYPRYI